MREARNAGQVFTAESETLRLGRSRYFRWEYADVSRKAKSSGARSDAHLKAATDTDLDATCCTGSGLPLAGEQWFTRAKMTGALEEAMPGGLKPLFGNRDRATVSPYGHDAGSRLVPSDAE